MWGNITSELLSNAEWNIDQGPAWRKSTVEVSSSQLKYKESHLVASFTIRRNPAYLERTVISPSILFYLISWAGLWIQLQAVPARAAMAVIPILCLTGTMYTVSNIIPPISYSTRLADMLVWTLIFTTLHALEFALVEFSIVRAKKLEEHAHEYRKVVVCPATVGATQAEAETPIAKDLEQAKMPSNSCQRFERLFMEWASTHFEKHLRWISPLCYGVIVIAVFWA